jgi:hypothetical protein
MCGGRSFAYVAHFVLLRDDWIRIQRAAVACRRATNLAINLLFNMNNNMTDSLTKIFPKQFHLTILQVTLPRPVIRLYSCFR